LVYSCEGLTFVKSILTKQLIKKFMKKIITCFPIEKETLLKFSEMDFSKKFKIENNGNYIIYLVTNNKKISVTK